jgi:release factor glutamine methyltransferase
MGEAVEGKFSAVLANPPYVSEAAYRELSREIYFEPENAFVGGEDGGDFYRHITPAYKDRLIEDGFIAYEIGYDQAELIRAVAKENGMSCQIINDYSDNPRVAVLKK